MAFIITPKIIFNLMIMLKILAIAIPIMMNSNLSNFVSVMSVLEIKIALFILNSVYNKMYSLYKKLIDYINVDN